MKIWCCGSTLCSVSAPPTREHPWYCIIPQTLAFISILSFQVIRSLYFHFLYGTKCTLKKSVCVCVRVCTCGRHQNAISHPIFSSFLHLLVRWSSQWSRVLQRSVTLPSGQQYESPGSLAGNTVGGVHSALPTRVPLYCVSPEGRSVSHMVSQLSLKNWAKY